MLSCAKFPELSIYSTDPPVAEPIASPIVNEPPTVCHVGAVPVPFDTSACPDVPYCPPTIKLELNLRSPENVEVAVVEVAAKKGAWNSPVERIVALALFEGPICVEFAIEFVIDAPNADAPAAETVKSYPTA